MLIIPRSSSESFFLPLTSSPSWDLTAMSSMQLPVSLDGAPEALFLFHLMFSSYPLKKFCSRWPVFDKSFKDSEIGSSCRYFFCRDSSRTGFFKLITHRKFWMIYINVPLLINIYPSVVPFKRNIIQIYYLILINVC